jgi:shikimate 5-dehydrogenase
LGDYSYELFEKEPEELEEFLKHGDFTGLNVTIPYKKAVIPYLDYLSPVAQKLGAVNTIIRRSDGVLMGHNTDYYGFRYMLKKSGLDVQHKKVLVLGSGGTSNTATAVLEELGDTIVLGRINLAEITKSQELAFQITLPEGVTNETGITEVTVTVRFIGVSTREMSVANIEILNVPKGMEVDLITRKLTVIVRGPTGMLSNLTEEDIFATVDFTDAEEGSSTFKAKIAFTDAFNKMGAVGTYSVSATVKAAAEE